MTGGSAGKWLVAIALWVVAILNYLDRKIVFSIFPVLRRDLGMSDVELGMLGSAFLFVYGIASLVAGYVALKKGLRFTILASLLLWSAVTLLTGYSQSGRIMIGARALMGLSEAFYIPAGLALIAALHDTTHGAAPRLCIKAVCTLELSAAAFLVAGLRRTSDGVMDFGS